MALVLGHGDPGAGEVTRGQAAVAAPNGLLEMFLVKNGCNLKCHEKKTTLFEVLDEVFWDFDCFE